MSTTIRLSGQERGAVIDALDNIIANLSTFRPPDREDELIDLLSGVVDRLIDSVKPAARFLTDAEQSAIIEECKLNCVDHMFGDGMEDQYALEGFPVWKGLLNMSDEELLDEYGHYDPAIHTTPELKAQAFRDELKEGEEP